MSCVNKSSKEFKALAANNNISANALELIVHKYWIETGSEENFPTDVYIQAQLGNNQYQENIEAVRQLWKERYQYPRQYSSFEELQKAYKEASQYFPQNAITYYKNDKGNFVLSVKQPVERVFDTASDFFNEDFSSAKTLDLGLDSNQTYTIDKVQELFNRFNTDRTSRHLAEKVFGIAKDLGIEVSFNEKLPFGKVGRAVDNNTITYKKSFLERDMMTAKKADVLLHEVIHAISMYALSDSTKNWNRSKDLEKFRNDVTSIFNEVSSNPILRGERGIHDVFEFVAELANPVFREKLQRIDAKNRQGRSIWQRILDAFKSLLGIHSSSAYYNRSMNALDKALNAFDIDSYLRYNGLKPTLQRAYNDHRVEFEQMSEEEIKSMLKDAIKEDDNTLNNKEGRNVVTDQMSVFTTVAPYYNTPITKGNKNEIQEKVEDDFHKRANAVADALGIEIVGIDTNVGGFKFSEGEAAGQQVRELSYTFELRNTTREQADLFASIMGDLGYEQQETVISYNEAKDADSADALNYVIKVNNTDGVADILEGIGITDYTINDTNKEISLLAFSKNIGEFGDKIDKLIKQLGDNYNGTEQQFIESRYLDKGARRDAYQKVWDKNNTPAKGKQLRAYPRETHSKEGQLQRDNWLRKQAIDILRINNQQSLLGFIDSMSKDQLISELQQIKQEYHDYDLVNENNKKTPKGRTAFTFTDGVTLNVPFTPNEQQAHALNVMNDFIHSKNVGGASMTLAGYAGTGKTSLMEIMAQKAKRDGKNVHFCATTNSAAKVLQTKVEKQGFEATTLNKAFGINVEVDPNKEYDTRNVIDNVTEANIMAGSVVIIDEASMINPNHYKVIKDAADELSLKIIYVGDKAQLPPVKQTLVSPVFRDPEAKVVELTKVERTDDNAILKEATALRNGQQLSRESSFNDEGKGVAYIDASKHQQAIDDIISHYAPRLSKDPNYFRILAYTNDKVVEYNNRVRKALGYNDGIPRVGEPMIGYKSWGYVYDGRDRRTGKAKGHYRLNNAESYTVTKVEQPQTVSVATMDNTVHLLTVIPVTLADVWGNTDTFNYVDIRNNPANRQAATALAKEYARIWKKGKYRSDAEISKQNEIASVLYTNDEIKEGKRRIQDKIIDFGYAMTTHKSQGSTFTNVLVDENDINRAQSFDVDGGEVVDFNNVDYTPSAQDYADATKTDNAEKVGEGESVDLGFGLESEPVATQPTQQASKLSSDVANIRRSLKYVAVSRATDTVTIVSSNVKKEDSPLNHIGKTNAEAKTTLPKESKKAPSLSNPSSLSSSSRQSSPQERTVTYHIEGSADGKRETYTIRGSHIFNKDGKEVFKEDSKNRRAIFANLAVQEKRAVVVEHMGQKYIVNNKDKIISVTSKNEISPTWERTPAILEKAHQAFANMSDRVPTVTQQLIDHIKNVLHIPVYDRTAMERYLREHGYNDIREARGKKREVFNSDIQDAIKPIQRYIESLPLDTDTSHGLFFIYKNAIYQFNTSLYQYEQNRKDGHDGFEIQEVHDISDLNDTELKQVEDEYQKGRSLDSILTFIRDEKRGDSDSIILTENRQSGRDNAGLDIQAPQGKANRGTNNQGGKGNKGASQIDNDIIQTFETPEGEIYGFVTRDGKMYLDETVISPEHPIHEYTHIWDAVVAKRNAKLWKRGIRLMQNFDHGELWNKIASDEHYGKKWRKQGLKGEELINRIASEVHARLVGKQGEKLIKEAAEKQGQKGIVAKLKKWLLDVWKEVKATFSNWTEDEINRLSLDDFVNMTVRDFADAVPLRDNNAEKQVGKEAAKQTEETQQETAQPPVEQQQPAKEEKLSTTSLSGYTYFTENYDGVEIDAEWKVPLLKDLDSQFSTEKTPEQNQEILNKMNDILNATTEDDYNDVTSQKKNETINKSLDEYDKINTQIDNLLEGRFLDQGDGVETMDGLGIRFSATEIRKVSEYIGNDISDIITKIQTEDGYAEKTFQGISLPRNANYASMTRVQIINAIGLDNIIEQAKKNFNPETFDYNDIETSAKAMLAMENWDALMLLASDTITLNEGFGIQKNYDKEHSNSDYEVTQGNNLQIDVDDPNEYHDEMAQEEEGDGQEHYQVDQRTVDTMWSMSALVRQAIHECYELNKDGSRKMDKEWQKPIRIEPRIAVNSILNWCNGAIDIHDMVDMLTAKQAKYTWLSQLITRLSDTSGKEADFQSQFFGVFCKAYQPYSIVLLENGKYTNVPVNDHPANKQAFDNIVAQYKVGNHPLFDTNGKIKEKVLGSKDSNSDDFTLRKAYNVLYPYIDKINKEESNPQYYGFELDQEDMKELAANINGVYRLLGFNTTEEAVLDVLDKPTIKEIASDLTFIVRDLDSALKAQKRNIGNSKAPKYEPFTYGKDNNIRNAVRKIITPITDVLEDTAINAFYDSGKMYQTYVIPSFLTKFANKIKNLPDDKFKTFMESEYGDSEWFRDKDGNWRNPMLARLANGDRSAFDFKVELNFNKHNYMRTMSDSEYVLSLVTEYFSESQDINGKREDMGYFRIPMESNKPSSEFFKWYAYKNQDRYKDQVTNDLFKFYLQEVSRIQTVRMRNKSKGDEGFIKNWDTNGRKFNFLPFLNSYLENDAVSKKSRTFLRNEDGTLSDDNDRLAKLLQRHIDGLEENKLTTDELASLEKLVKRAIRNYMQERADKILDSWEKGGIIEAARKVKNIVIDDSFLNENEEDPVKRNENVRKSIENFIWNDFLAANNILELTVGDIAFYKDAEDLQKRLSELHAPGIRANVYATDYKGNRVSDDGKYRTALFKDFNTYKSNIIANISEVCNRIIARAPESQKPALRAWKESLVGKNGHYTRINVADAQGLSSPSSYRKKALMFGKWSRHAEEIYNKLLKGEYNYDDLQVAFQTLKPFVYTHLTKNLGVDNAPITKMHVPFQAKNSEYLLIMADAMIQGEIAKSGELSRPNLLRAVYDIMEDSAYDGRVRDTATGEVKVIGTYNGKGIDTFQFESAIKSGEQTPIDIAQFMNMEGGRAAAYEYLKGKLYNTDGTYNTDSYVHEAPFEDYAIQQEVPDHFKEHKQGEGSQVRMIIPSDLDYYKNPNLPENERDAEDNIVYYEWTEPDGTKRRVNAREFREEYEETIADNIEYSLSQLAAELRLDPNIYTRKERNIALSTILQRELLSSPRYGVDLIQACQVDKKTGEFRIPKGDPIQAKRIEQLINSIIKNRVNKQEIAGGPVVQVTNFGTSRQLQIRFNDKQGNLLKTKDEFFKDDNLVSQYKTYEKYAEENQGGIAYFEVFAPIWSDQLAREFADENGNIDIQAIENADPELLRMVSYRIPTEDKYSTAPMKVVGFLPREAGSAIMLPYELTEIDDSDFDVDKRYIMRKDLPLKMKRKGEVAKAIEEVVFDSFKRAHNGKISNEQKQHYRGIIDLYLSDKVSGNYNADSKYAWNGSNITPFIHYLDGIFKRVGWTTSKPEKGTKRYRDNKIIDMSLAVLTNEYTADKILNPGGFDNFKKSGYMIEAFRKHASEGMSWQSLQNMSIDELKSMSDTDKHLGWVDTEVQFYNQNCATTSMIGIYAVNKIAHAILEGNGILIDTDEICGEPFTIDGHLFQGRIEIDPRYDIEGSLIGKTLGSGVSASADGVKAPVQNLMNINTSTAGVFNTMLRLGLPFEDAALLISQDVITRVLRDFSQQRLNNYVSLNDIVQEHIDEIKKDNVITDNAAVRTQDLTKEQLIAGLVPTKHVATDYKVLCTFQKFMALSDAMRKPTFATRFNSISSAVGPLIIDNLILEHKMEDFGYGQQTGDDNTTHFYNKEGLVVDIDDIFNDHPILKQFSRTVDIAKDLFSDMPAGSQGFRNILKNLPNGLSGKIFSDKQLLSKLSDFYQSYLLLASGLVKSDDLKYYVEEFPKWFDKQGFKQKYPDNPLIQAINLKVSKTNRPFLEIRITGMDQTQKDILGIGWIDLHKENPDLSTKLFIYNFFRAGIGFSPKTFMALVPTYVKEHLERTRTDGSKATYVDTYRHMPSVIPSIVIDQFIRNNWTDNKLVPWRGGKNSHFNVDYKGGILTVTDENEVRKMANDAYIKTKYFKNTYLWKQVGGSVDEGVLTFKMIKPLGDNNEYLEMYLTDKRNGLTDTTVLDDDNAPDSPNNSQTDMQEQGQTDESTGAAIDTSKQDAYNMSELVDLVIKQVREATNGRTVLNRTEALNRIEDMKNNPTRSGVSKFLVNVFKQKGLKLDEKKAMEEFKRYC